MTKKEIIKIATMTAEAWLALHEQELQNANSATSWAEYQEFNNDKYTSMCRCMWCGMSNICDALGINLLNETQVGQAVTELMQETTSIAHQTWLVYSTFPDYKYGKPRKAEAEVKTDATNRDDEKEV